MKRILTISLLLLSVSGWSQELFSVTEPASNKAARSITFRLDNTMMDDLSSTKVNYHMIPEIMLGISKKTDAEWKPVLQQP